MKDFDVGARPDPLVPGLVQRVPGRRPAAQPALQDGAHGHLHVLPPGTETFKLPSSQESGQRAITWLLIGPLISGSQSGARLAL